ncbi:thioredoxin, mitochondrial [Pelobates cultripes]|uniref:Thioredoxin, mitochondrial n=1 Tax=Pelobates cultripes TaxID=61616 RepID=A0AAD1TPZ2_PELCU|nr:thioredoxin, mitochondrial [Pelobates cultripes]
MAQRILLNRSLAQSVKGCIVREQHFSNLIVKGTKPLYHGPLHTSDLSSPFFCAARHFSRSAQCRVTFNVQDADDFQERVVCSETPILVDFHAQWCGPCKILAPRLEKMVAKHQGKVQMAKVDIDDNTDLAIKYEVSAVPTVLAMRNGGVVDKFVGLKDEDQLEVFLKKLIGP